MLRTFSNAFAITITSECEQAYSYDSSTQKAWIHVKVNPKSTEHLIAGENSYGKCVSIRIDPEMVNSADLNGYELCSSRVETMSRMTFRQAENILYAINEASLDEAMFTEAHRALSKLYELALCLKRQRIGDETLKTVFLKRADLAVLGEQNFKCDVETATEELSIFANHVLNQYVILAGIPRLRYAQLYVNKFEDEKRARLSEFLGELDRARARNCHTIKQKLFVLQARSMIAQPAGEVGDPSDGIHIVLPTYKRSSQLLDELLEAHASERLRFVRVYYEEL